MKLPFNSIRARLTVSYALVISAIILVFAVGVYFFVRTNILNLLRVNLQQDAANIEFHLVEEPGELQDLEERSDVDYFYVTGETGTIFESRGWRQAGLHGVLDTWTDQRFRLYDLPERDHFYVFRTQRLVNDDLVTIAVARDAEVALRSVRTLVVILIVGYLLAIAVAVLSSYFMAGRVLAPFGRLATKAQEISAENLSERLPVQNPQDEFGQLATAFNRTLERIDRAFDHLRRFTADASHELRTPLTALRSVGEVSLQKRRPSPEYYRDVIGSMLEEADRLSLLVDNLLILTRGDAGQVPLDVDEVSLLSLVRETADNLQVLAEEKRQQIVIEAEEDVIVLADFVKLRQALINLLDNAVKYTPPGGSITMRLRRTLKGKAVIEVIDTGVGIDAEHHRRVFDRFYRIEANRQEPAGGAGLGLAIAQWAVELNGGTIELESALTKGSTFRITLPYATHDRANGTAGAGKRPDSKDVKLPTP